MSDTKEPLAAVLAEFRARAEEERECGWHGEADDLLAFADRIERAAKNTENAFGMALAIEDGLHKRDKQSAPGNSAAMRESLVRLDRIAFGVLEFPLDGDSSEIYEANKKKVELPAWCIAELLNAAKGVQDAAHAALSAPARNCDRFQTAEDALDAFIREKEIKAADVDNMNLRDFFVWLFAKAEGKDNSNG